MTDPAVSPFDLIREALTRAFGLLSAYQPREQSPDERAEFDADLRSIEDASDTLDQLQRDHEALTEWVDRNAALQAEMAAATDAAVREAEALRGALRALWYEFPNALKAQRDDPEIVALCEMVRAALASARDEQELVGTQLEHFGSVEGRLEETVVYQRRVFYIRETLSNRRIECFFAERVALEDVLAAFGRRVSVRGLIRTRRTGEKLSIEVRELYVFPPDAELPTIEEVQGIFRAEFPAEPRDTTETT